MFTTKRPRWAEDDSQARDNEDHLFEPFGGALEITRSGYGGHGGDVETIGSGSDGFGATATTVVGGGRGGVVETIRSGYGGSGAPVDDTAEKTPTEPDEPDGYWLLVYTEADAQLVCFATEKAEQLAAQAAATAKNTLASATEASAQARWARDRISLARRGLQ